MAWLVHLWTSVSILNEWNMHSITFIHYFLILFPKLWCVRLACASLSHPRFSSKCSSSAPLGSLQNITFLGHWTWITLEKILFLGRITELCQCFLKGNLLIQARKYEHSINKQDVRRLINIVVWCHNEWKNECFSEWVYDDITLTLHTFLRGNNTSVDYKKHVNDSPLERPI